jgi:hypothetical protein
MSQYLLLLYHENPAEFRNLKPEDRQKAIAKYLAYGDKLRDTKVYVSSSKLADDPGRVMHNKNGRVVTTDGPFGETKEWLGGYYLIEAPNYEAAVEIGRGCPQLEYGGSVVVRELDPMTAAATRSKAS